MHAIICTQGQMNPQEVLNECGKEKWVPILVYRHQGKTIVPCFDAPNVLLRFTKRNLGEKKDWYYGCVNLEPENIDWFKNKGFEIRLYDYPQKLSGEFDIEVLELDPDAETEVWERKKNAPPQLLS